MQLSYDIKIRHEYYNTAWTIGKESDYEMLVACGGMIYNRENISLHAYLYKYCSYLIKAVLKSRRIDTPRNHRKKLK
jgi:hypothetical protein